MARKGWRETDHAVTRVRVQGDCRHPYEADEPSGYLAWHAWAEEHMKTHRHKQCPKCGLWTICASKRETPSRGRTGA